MHLVAAAQAIQAELKHSIYLYLSISMMLCHIGRPEAEGGRQCGKLTFYLTNEASSDTLSYTGRTPSVSSCILIFF